MRRSLTRATAACAAHALALSLWAAAPAEGETAPGEGGTPRERDGEAAERATVGTEPGGPREAGSAYAVDGASTDTAPSSDRTESAATLRTHVDQAFPDTSYGDDPADSVGTGRLVWDRVYTRRALFRFPVEPESEAAVDSAVLRADVAWSYDCDNDAAVQLHQVEPFDERATWNDQPTVRALLDSREIGGARAACPAAGSAEFDLTGAYQEAADRSADHIHLRLSERDESGTTAWRRFDVEDTPPTLVVDHSTQAAPEGAPEAVTDSTGPSGEPQDGSADTGPSGNRAEVHRNEHVAPPAGHTGPVAVGAHTGPRPPAPAGGPRSRGERDRSRDQSGNGRPTAPDGPLRWTGAALPEARGPPAAWRPQLPAVDRQHETGRRATAPFTPDAYS
ncbi:DNRLRE domain-containing protein [Nocardiopsis xinjiangensis]|uniref:DNRLRE domain-containing protein n=1 Tax=Nocardiopsis xinjiangensis TaxID=124285 RepID=UPI00034670B5|nr:DNRLRE domain-containing protein [Nocardiopsis xinjiangensis]